MLDFLFDLLRLFAFAGCLILLRSSSVSYFIKKRIFRSHSKIYYNNNKRKNSFERYLFYGFGEILPSWLIIYNYSWIAFSAVVLLLLIIGFAFALGSLIKFSLMLFLYIMLLAIELNLLYNLLNPKFVRKWCFFGLMGMTMVNILITIIVWNICF